MKKNKGKEENFVKLYVPELRQLVESGDEKMCLMMAQLEYWFGGYPNGFYKFMSPPQTANRSYKVGDSWTEEMGMSATKIANGLKPICTHYQSFTAYNNEDGDKFKGKFYCSYYHKPSHQTYYLRNHDEVNEALESLSLGNKSTIFREKHSTKVGNNEMTFSGDGETDGPEVIDVEVVYTETTTKNTTKDYSQERERNSHTVENENINQNLINKNQEESDSSFTVDSDEGVIVGEFVDDWQSAKNVAVPFPANFELTEEMIAWAKDKNPKIDVEAATEKFKIFHGDNVNKNWLKKWQLWILDEKQQYSSGSSGMSTEELYRSLLN